MSIRNISFGLMMAAPVAAFVTAISPGTAWAEDNCANGLTMDQYGHCVPFSNNTPGCVAGATLVAGQCVYTNAELGTGSQRGDTPPERPLTAAPNECEAGLTLDPSGQCVALGDNSSGDIPGFTHGGAVPLPVETPQSAPE